MPTQITRKIYFYKIYFEKYTGDSSLDIVNAIDVFNEINGLFNSDDRYLRFGSDALFMIVDDLNADKIKARIIASRHTGLPHLETDGVISPLNIPDESGLGEISHFVIFNGDTLGMEFNFYGPRSGRIAEYVRYAAGLIVDSVETVMIINRDATETLQKIGEVKAFNIKIRRDATLLYRDFNADISSAFSSIGEASDAEDIEIIFRTPGKNRWLNARTLLTNLGGFLRRDEVREGTDKFKVEGRNALSGKTEYFDLLEDKFVLSKRVDKPSDRYNSVDTNSMYRAIEDAYIELRPNIERGLSNGR